MMKYTTSSKNIVQFQEIIERMKTLLEEKNNWPKVLTVPIYVFVLSSKTPNNIILSPEIGNVARVKTFLEVSATDVYRKTDFTVGVDTTNKYNKTGKWIGLRVTKNKDLIEMYAAMCLMVLGLENNLITQP